MRKLPIAITIALMSLSAPAFAQEASVVTTQSIEPAEKPSALHVAMSEVAILRCRAALKLRAEWEQAAFNRIVPLLQVVVNNMPETPGGGGTPRRAPAPELIPR